MEAVQSRVQSAVTKLIEDLDKQCLRKMQIDMYKCNTACCENPNYRMDDVQHCVEKCSVPVQRAQEVIQHELSGFQNRLQRCAMDCQDKVKDKAGINVTDAQAAQYRTELEKCVAKCGETHIDLIPSMFKRMKDVLHATAKK